MKLDERITLLCAFRYSLGRMTYVVSSVINQIIKNWNGLKDSEKSLIKKEINEAITQGHAGMNMDINQWRRILELSENRSRGKNNG